MHKQHKKREAYHQMLSIENPQPDPPCPCLLPHLKNGSDHDQRASHKLPLPDLDPSLDHPHPHRHYRNQPAGFSIRDYVFTARSKDIKKNWPFSLKNLQLCLNHGVKDPLPPFQPLDTIRSQAFQTCTVESSEHQTETIANVNGDPCDDQKLENGVQSNHNAASSCRSGNDFPSTTSSVSQSEIESVPARRPPSSSPVEADPLLETSAARLPPSRKADTASRLPSKKCRLIVKFGPNSDRSSTEDIASNCTTISETMASKTCPVCKTFSSTSNTTLNAHIDQCLSAESTPKWKADSKLTRPRIKGRKIKPMTDIYATAQPCTLEELDRRNGTSWAVVSTLPAPDINDFASQPISDEPRNQKVDNAGEVGPVYIDANGTKLRILSKLGTESQPVLKVTGKDLGPKKPFKGGKGSQLLATKKKRRHGKKHLKYLKLASQSRKYLSYKTQHASQIPEGQEESFKKEELPRPKEIKVGEPGTLGQWACSKRTGLVKKLNKQGCKWQHATQNLQVENDQSCLHDSVITRNQVQKLTKLPISSPSSSENIHRAEKPYYDARICNKKELSSEKKRAGSPLFGAMAVDNIERSLPPAMRNTNQLSKDSCYVLDNRIRKAPESTKHNASSLSKRKFPIDAVNCSGIPPVASVEPSTTTRPFISKFLRVPQSRKNGSSAKESSVVESRSSVDKEHSSLRNFQLHFMAEVDEEVAPWQSATDHTENHGEGEESTNETSFNRGNMTGVRQQPQDKEPMRISLEENVPLKSSQLALLYYGEHVGRNSNSSDRAEENNLQEKVDSPESVGGTVTHLSKHLDAKFHKVSDYSKTGSSVPHYLEENNGGHLSGDETFMGPKETSFAGEQIYCTDEVGNGIIEQTAHMEEELDSDGGQANSFPEVDPIPPIPGPPGSFLPSPRDMGSDDFPGNSSLTTSRAQSSQDQLDFIDGDSSESPISMASTILNSRAVRSDLKYSEPFSSVVLSVQEKTSSGFCTANVEHSVDIASSALGKSTGMERTFEGEKFAVHRISLEKKPFSFKNDNQPCCCQRKERVSQGIALNYQDSQLLRRRAIASMSVPNGGKQMGANPNFRPGNLDKRPEIVPLSSCQSPESEKVVVPVMKPPSDPIHFDGSPDNGVKFPGRVACDSPSPSSSNPILRLMGKNLLVVNKEEGASLPLGQAQSSSPNNHPASQYTVSSNVSPGNLGNQDRHSFHHMAPQGSLIFGQSPRDAVGQYFDVRNGFRSHTGLRTLETPAQVPVDMFLNRHLDSRFAATSVEPYNSEEDCHLSCQQSRSKNRSGAAPVYNVQKVMTTLDCKQRNQDSAASFKEIIVIDDNDTEPSLAGSVVKYSDQSLRKRQMVSGDTLNQPAHSYNSTHISPFSSYQPQEAPLVESCLAKNNGFHTIPPRRANASPARWGCISEGASVLHRGPFMAAPSSTSNLRSPLYYSPSM